MPSFYRNFQFVHLWDLWIHCTLSKSLTLLEKLWHWWSFSSLKKIPQNNLFEHIFLLVFSQVMFLQSKSPYRPMTNTIGVCKGKSKGDSFSKYFIDNIKYCVAWGPSCSQNSEYMNISRSKNYTGFLCSIQGNLLRYAS